MPSSIYKQVASQPHDFSLVGVGVAGCSCAMQKKVKRWPAVANDASVSAPKLLKAVFTVNRIRTPLKHFDLFIEIFFF